MACTKSDAICCFFFFQAEDGIRDVAVTGVQTCALPICPVSPVINWKRTVLAAVSKLSQVGSTRCCWALAGPASKRVTNPTIAARPTLVDRRHFSAGGAIPSLGIVPHPSVELRFHHSKHRSLIVFFFSLPQ